MIKAFIPWVRETEKAVVTGGTDSLGNWNPAEGVPLRRLNAFSFISDIKIGNDEEWKLVLIRDDGSYIWEEGDNRTGTAKETAVFRGGRRAKGTEIPVFSLRSPSDNGIGDFGSLLQFLNIAKSEGYRAVQILPIADTGSAIDPYEIVSALAINPIYLCLDRMGALKDVETAHAIADKSEELSYSEIVEWEEVKNIKWQYFRAIYMQEREAVLGRKDFRQFMEREKDWLLPYCVFNYLKETGKTETCSPAIIDKLMKDDTSRNGILFHAFLQFHADIQLREVHEEYSKAGILLAGEIPYGVSRGSADVWQNPAMFLTEFDVGTIPDAKHIRGLKFNRVPFNWNDKKLMKWWKVRLKKMSLYFDICRLENAEGYFRQWMVPRSYGTALRGQTEPCPAYSLDALKDAGYEIGKDKDLEPLITRDYLQTLLGSEFKRFGEFFKRRLDGRYYFKQEFQTADAIRSYFRSRKKDESELCDGLVSILDECMFVKTAGGYQPRIAAQYTNAYRALDQKQKDVFNRIYDRFYYSAGNTELWNRTGRNHLKTLSGLSSMLLYADCSMPSATHDVMGMAVERKGEKAEETDIAIPYRYDMPSFREWWSSLSDNERQVYWSDVMGWKDRASSKPIPAIHSDIVKRMSQSHSPLVIIPYQDKCRPLVDYNGNPVSERISTPDNRTTGWTWRIPD